MSDIHVERDATGKLHALVRGSSNVSEFHYDPNEEVLTVMYRGGRTYQYENVREKLVKELCEAPSVGKFLNTFIVDIYKATKL